MTQNEFDLIRTTIKNSGPAAAISELCRVFRDQQRYHELFEATKMQVRHNLGLPLLYGDSGEELDEPLRQQLEEGLIQACREVGELLMKQGEVRQGYNYLRPVGDAKTIKQLMSAIEVNDDNVDQFIEICFGESVDLKRGMELLLQYNGTCNAITAFESAMYGRPRSEREIGAKLLVDHLHRELKENLIGHIERQEHEKPNPEQTIPQLMNNRDYLTADGAYHVDTTHLASAVRFARDLSDHDSLNLAIEIASYGLQLDQQLQYPGDEPFTEMYASHILYFETLKQQNGSDGLAYFEKKARACNAHEETTFAIEVYVDLLHRIGKTQQAMEALKELIPYGMQTTGFGPNLIDLCESIQDYGSLEEICEEQNDLLGFSMAVLKASSQSN